ncbi:unnamed protein product, partial [Mesorhabditis spiculigera]
MALDVAIGPLQSQNGSLFEIAGLTGTGKTQFLYTLVANLLIEQPNERCGGLTRTAHFDPSRLIQILENRAYQNPASALTRIAFSRINGARALITALEKISFDNALYGTTCGDLRNGRSIVTEVLGAARGNRYCGQPRGDISKRNHHIRRCSTATFGTAMGLSISRGSWFLCKKEDDSRHD